MNARAVNDITPGELLGHYIAGNPVPGNADRRTLAVTNPATGAVTHQVELADAALVNSAIDAAAAAFPAWRDTPPAKRAAIMFRFKQLLEEHAEEIAGLITSEHGKVFDDALGEFGRGVEVVDYACGIAELLKGEYSRNVGRGIDAWSDHQPLGVVAGITPFNFPAMVPMWMFPMAIACGNTFVLKPSEKDPSAPLYLARLLTEAGLPDGVFNVVNGDKEAVDTLLDDQRVQAMSFVGSTPVAEYIYTRGAANGKRIQALGGAKNHAIVMPDADIDNATNALIGAAFGSCGERCMAISVVVCVGDETADRTVAALRARAAAIRVGNGEDTANDMGPLVTREHRDKVRSYVDLGVEEGAELVLDGRGLVVDGLENGFFLGPCLFDRVTKDMRIYQEEIFGPVLCVVRARSEEDALSLVNGHEYGNGTCIFTRDGEAARYFADKVEVGMVGINIPLPVPVAYHSFGGWKRSLFGDLHAYGPDSVRFYTRRKQVTQRWPSGGVRVSAEFAFPSSGQEK
jgi:malonate-semialdehyde dehydrogenase (acetylating)/methylmalonate-semialdehyde dehydrogenase